MSRKMSHGRNQPGISLVIMIIFLSMALLLGLATGGGCAAKKIIDRAYVTARGMEAAKAVNQKASEGYDVREARAKWMEALSAYNREEYAEANRLIDETYLKLKGVPKVAERIFYESSGGLIVSGLLFKPREGVEPWPLIVVNHAGLGTAADFSDVALIIRDQGYLVFNPDYRGSGESQGEHELAKGEVDDVIYGIEYLKSQGLVEDDRIGMYGQSHGAGVAMLVAERYEGIKAVVEEAGFSDAEQLYYHAQSTDDPVVKEVMKEFVPIIGGTPEEVPQEYYMRSPINFVENMHGAIYLIHGARDPIIPQEQAYQMYKALKAAGKTAELKIYPEEGHCVGDPAGRMEVWEIMFDWFKKHV